MVKNIKKIINKIGIINISLYLFVIVINILTLSSSFISLYFFSKLIVILFPIYMWILFENGTMIIDKYFIVLPISFWLIFAFIFGFKSGLNSLIVEPQIIVMLSGLYLSRFLINQDIIKRKIAIVLVLINFLMAFLVYHFVPIFGD